MGWGWGGRFETDDLHAHKAHAHSGPRLEEDNFYTATQWRTATPSLPRGHTLTIHSQSLRK